MRAREVARKLVDRGATEIRRKGSHRRFRSACGKCSTTVPDHAGADIPRGTLGGIQKDMEPCYGKGWLFG